MARVAFNPALQLHAPKPNPLGIIVLAADTTSPQRVVYTLAVGKYLQ